MLYAYKILFRPKALILIFKDSLNKFSASINNPRSMQVLPRLVKVLVLSCSSIMSLLLIIYNAYSNNIFASFYLSLFLLMWLKSFNVLTTFLDSNPNNSFVMSRAYLKKTSAFS